MKIDNITKILLIFTFIISVVNLGMLINKKEASAAEAAESGLAGDAQFQGSTAGFFFYVPSEGKIYKYTSTGRKLQTYVVTKLGEDFKMAY